MNVACSSTTFAMHLARQMVLTGAARNVLVLLARNHVRASQLS